MNKFVSVLFCIALLVSAVCAGTADAEDEDTQASVYLVFDPETGEFVTVEDPAVTAQHEARQEQEAIDSVIETGNESLKTTIAGATFLLLLLGGAVWLRRNRK